MLVALCGVDVGVAGEIYKRKPLAGSVSADTAFRAIMGCPDSALGVVRAKQPHAMTTEDAPAAPSLVRSSTSFLRLGEQR